MQNYGNLRKFKEKNSFLTDVVVWSSIFNLKIHNAATLLPYAKETSFDSLPRNISQGYSINDVHMERGRGVNREATDERCVKISGLPCSKTLTQFSIDGGREEGQQ